MDPYVEACERLENAGVRYLMSTGGDTTDRPFEKMEPTRGGGP